MALTAAKQPDLDFLKHRLSVLKESEAAIKRERQAVEREIVKLLKEDLKPEGTTRLHGLKIVTGYNRKWDQSYLHRLVEVDRIPPKLFPFKTEYKEERTKSRYIEENEPKVWAYIAKALTLTPKKPAISIIEKEEG